MREGRTNTVSGNHAEDKTEKQNTMKLEIGTWVTMTSENSNWTVGEKARISFVGSDRVGVYFPSRGDTADDDYTAFLDAFEVAK